MLLCLSASAVFISSLNFRIHLDAYTTNTRIKDQEVESFRIFLKGFENPRIHLCAKELAPGRSVRPGLKKFFFIITQARRRM